MELWRDGDSPAPRPRPIPASGLLPDLAAQGDLFSDRGPGGPGEEGLPVAGHHAGEHLPGHCQGDFVGL